MTLGHGRRLVCDLFVLILCDSFQDAMNASWPVLSTENWRMPASVGMRSPMPHPMVRFL
jgi:hypothetical protein